MNYLDVETAKKIVCSLSAEIPYVPRAQSARCPLCGNWGDRIYNCTRHLKNGNIHRYFACPDCGFKFKAVEMPECMA